MKIRTIRLHLKRKNGYRVFINKFGRPFIIFSDYCKEMSASIKEMSRVRLTVRDFSTILNEDVSFDLTNVKPLPIPRGFTRLENLD